MYVMKLNNREALDQYRKEAKVVMDKSEAEDIKIYVGMGTCGIAAGAQGVLNAVLEELKNRQIKAKVIQTGCIGMCVKEPLIDVKLPGRERITYGNLKPADIPRIIDEHVQQGNVVEDLAVARFEELS